MRRIIGQCNQADFANIEHIALTLDKPEMLDISTLKKKEKFAFVFMGEARERGISWKLLRGVVREVLFWGYGDKVIDVEIRFLRDATNLIEITKFRKLWRLGGDYENKGVASGCLQASDCES